MDTALLVALLNPSIALVLAAAALMFWLYQRPHPCLATMAVGYTGTALGFLLQYFPLPLGFAATKITSNVGFLAGGACIMGAVVLCCGRRVPVAAFGALGAAGLAAFLWALLVVPDLTWRVYAVNFALGGMSLVTAAQVRRARRDRPAERVLFVLMLLASASLLGRTVLVMTLHGAYSSYQEFYNSTYWTSQMLMHAVLLLLIALAIFSATALDVMEGLTADARTDPLSLLLNRRGFEERVAELLDRSGRAGLPVALVLADLDHFKAVNDLYGHWAGDRVIADFAARLETAAGGAGVVGRLGGEEFAVMLPLADAAAARMLAEGVRASLSAGGIDGVPPDMRVTASFGVAVRSGTEGLGQMMRRADAALYEAKQNGRDSVVVCGSRQEAARPRPVSGRG